MKITNGKIVIAIGIIHTLCTVSPPVYGRQFIGFARRYFFRINDGFLEVPSMMGGRMDYETFAAFWCFSWGILLLALGVLLESVEKKGSGVPGAFIWSYSVIVLIGVYMIPFSGITLFMLPHVIYMVAKYRRDKRVTA